MFKSIAQFVSNNIYLIIGICVGLYFTALVSPTIQPTCHSPRGVSNNPAVENRSNPLKLKPVLPKKPSGTKTKLIRPRYYSTELGIREKLFLGVFTSEEKITTQVVHLNKTVHHLVDKVKFFFTAQHKMKKKFNITGLVGFTDTRHKYRPFQVMKYVGDNFNQDYDFYYFGYDHTFVNARKLVEMVKKISVGMHIYLGNKVDDGSFCNLDSGIILSNSVLKAIREHLDWCVINSVSDDHSENLGRCIHHSIGLTCQESIQGQSLDSYKVKHFELKQHLSELSKKYDFNKAITVHPIIGADNFYLLNTYFLRQRLVQVKQSIEKISHDLNESWPPGQKPHVKPATRFDLPRQLYFNSSHMFFADDFVTVRPHTQSELMDIDNIIDYIVAKVGYESDKFQYRRLINGYRTFDLSRGMDYVFDLGFRDLSNGKEVMRRFEVCKPLGKVELTPMPYMTENTRINIVLPIQENEVDLAMEFLTDYAATIMERKEKTLLMLVLMYRNETASQGPDDWFGKIKKLAEQSSGKFRNEDNKIAWVSVRLPLNGGDGLILEKNKALNLAVIDLALKKIGLNSLILRLDVHTNITVDFLNRVRMNTIPGVQIFSAIPFRQYNPKITESPNLDINKNNGHFDKEEYRFISFYSNDYVTVRKKFENHVPIIRVDNDIALITDERYYDSGNIFELFVKYGGNIHCMRATESGLKVKFHEETDLERENWFIASGSQLGRYLLAKKDQIMILS